MNVFVLCTGRCGSTTFIKACQHISNYTASHESRISLLGDERLDYPENHIEADNRLSWFLGRLDEKFGDRAFYVHLTRDQNATAKSFNSRWQYKKSIIRGYARDILMRNEEEKEQLSICQDYCYTINTNNKLFLKDKSKKMTFELENATNEFYDFWQRIGAQGDLSAALNVWLTKFNSTEASITSIQHPNKFHGKLQKFKKMIKELVRNF
ncbi:hypothetical protein ABN584_17650 [Gloeocapsa sp. BRSZ]